MNLDSVTVLDLTQLLPGPYATQLLSDMGANVIKVEPLDGDPARHLEITGDRSSGLFDMVNRGKQSIALDLKADGGRECFLQLAVDADVVIEQFRPNVVSRLGIDYEAVRDRNPEIVYCSLSGYGQTGPRSGRVGHDLNYIASAGLLDLNRAEPEDEPVVPGFPIADMAGGMTAATCVLGALLSRELGTGTGEYLDVSMTDVVVSMSQIVAANALDGERIVPGGTALAGALPCYGVYKTADGGYVTLAALEPRFWKAFCSAVGREDLVEFHLASDEAVREELRTELSDLFEERMAEEWEARLGDEDVMFATVDTVNEALESELVAEREMVLEGIDGAPLRIGFPARSSASFDVPRGPAPALGEHTETVLRNHDIDAATMTRLRDADGIGT